MYPSVDQNKIKRTNSNSKRNSLYAKNNNNKDLGQVINADYGKKGATPSASSKLVKKLEEQKIEK